ncbi:MAG: diguanylate cyclase [Pseudomonadota bacterium]
MVKLDEQEKPALIAPAIYGLCFFLVLAFAFSNFTVLRSASDIADGVRRDVERKLVRNEIDRQIEVQANQQSQIAQWDDTVKALGPKIDAKFVKVEVADWLWDDFDIQSTVIVAPDFSVRVAIYEDRVMDPSAGSTMVEENLDLIKEAHQRYMKLRKPANQGFVVVGNPLSSENPLYASVIRKVEGQTGILVAQAIVGDDDAAIPDGPPHTLITFKPLNEAVQKGIADKLAFSGFSIVPKSPVNTEQQRLVFDNLSKSVGYQAVWNSEKPSGIIWSHTLPILFALLAVVAAKALFVSWRYADALKNLVKSEAQNRFLALHDALTGLPNRLHFDRVLDETFQDGACEQFAILCLDLDKFKAVNDTYGHPAGDTVIVTVAERISEAIGEDGIAARVGGDEFIVLMRRRLERDQMMLMCDNLIESISQEILFDGGSSSVGASIGVAWWPDDAKSPKNVIRAADAALYKAKEHGRGRTYLACEPVQGAAEAKASDKAFG